jgi:hypothetical protein
VPDVLDTQSSNRFSYVVNKPLTLSDPSGHDWSGGGAVETVLVYGSMDYGTISGFGDGAGGMEFVTSPMVLVTASVGTGSTAAAATATLPSIANAKNAATKNGSTQNQDTSVAGDSDADTTDSGENASPNSPPCDGDCSASKSNTPPADTNGENTKVAANGPNVQHIRQVLENNGIDVSNSSDEEVLRYYNKIQEYQKFAIEHPGVNPTAVGEAAAAKTVLQRGDNTISKATAKALGFDNPRDAGRALEALKKDNGLQNDFHGQIMGNGDFMNPHTGEVYGNILDYKP